MSEGTLQAALTVRGVAQRRAGGDVYVEVDPAAEARVAGKVLKLHAKRAAAGLRDGQAVEATLHERRLRNGRTYVHCVGAVPVGAVARSEERGARSDGGAMSEEGAPPTLTVRATTLARPDGGLCVAVAADADPRAAGKVLKVQSARAIGRLRAGVANVTAVLAEQVDPATGRAYLVCRTAYIGDDEVAPDEDDEEDGERATPEEAAAARAMIAAKRDARHAASVATAADQAGRTITRTPLLRPADDRDFVITPEQARLLSAVSRLRRHTPVNVKLVGPKGTGKSSLPKVAAARWGHSFFKINMGRIQTADELYGYRDARGGETTFVSSGFIEALETPDCDILIDEINRAHSTLLGGLIDLLDESRETYVDYLGRWVRVAPGVCFWVTLNVGPEYSGTWTLDAAIDDRLNPVLEVDWLPADQEAAVLIGKTGVEPAIATRLVAFAAEVRAWAELPEGNEDRVATAPGMRTMLKAAELIARGGLTAGEALRHTILPQYERGAGGEREKVGMKLQLLFAGDPTPPAERLDALDDGDKDDALPF